MLCADILHFNKRYQSIGTRTSRDVGTLQHIIIIALSYCICLLHIFCELLLVAATQGDCCENQKGGGENPFCRIKTKRAPVGADKSTGVDNTD